MTPVHPTRITKKFLTLSRVGKNSEKPEIAYTHTGGQIDILSLENCLVISTKHIATLQFSNFTSRKYPGEMHTFTLQKG